MRGSQDTATWSFQTSREPLFWAVTVDTKPTPKFAGWSTESIGTAHKNDRSEGEPVGTVTAGNAGGLDISDFQMRISHEPSIASKNGF